MNYFFNAPSTYFPLLRMLHSCRNNYIIRNLHERCLKLIYDDKNLSYEELLTKDGSVTIHHKNIQTFAVELCKVKNVLPLEIITKNFACETETHYSLRWCNDFRIPPIRAVYHGSVFPL